MTARLPWKVTEVAHLNGDRVLHVQGELDNVTARELADHLRRLCRLGRAVSVDLADVSFIDSTGLTVLLGARAEAARDGWTFAVRRPSPAVRRILALASAERLLGVEPEA